MAVAKKSLIISSPSKLTSKSKTKVAKPTPTAKLATANKTLARQTVTVARAIAASRTVTAMKAF